MRRYRADLIDRRLTELGKTRAWLRAETGRRRLPEQRRPRRPISRSTLDRLRAGENTSVDILRLVALCLELGVCDFMCAPEISVGLKN